MLPVVQPLLAQLTPFLGPFKARRAIKARRFFRRLLRGLMSSVKGKDAAKPDIPIDSPAANGTKGGDTGPIPGSFLHHFATRALHRDTKEPISEEEVISQAVLFLLAGFETTANTLAFCLHLLALHPDIQDKLVAEVDAKAPGNRCPTVEELAGFEYTEAVLDETLRLIGERGGTAAGSFSGRAHPDPALPPQDPPVS